MARLTAFAWDCLACIGYMVVMIGAIYAATVALTYTDWYGY
jgi:hypothetical protein